MLLTNMILPAAVESIGQITVGGNFQALWWDQKVKQAVSMRRNCLKTLRSHGTPQNLEHFKSAAKTLTRTLRKSLRSVKKAEMRLINALAKTRGESKALWKQLDWRRPHMLKGAQTETPTVRMPMTDRLVCDEPRVCEAFRQEFESNGVVQTEETEFDEDFSYGWKLRERLHCTTVKPAEPMPPSSARPSRRRRWKWHSARPSPTK